MPKRCGCQDACSCLVINGDGITVDGIGTIDRPYVISTEAANSLNDQLIFDDGDTIDFVTSGGGSSASPTHVTAEATLAMTDLTDVEAGPPLSGEVPVWQTDHWAFQPPPVAPAGATNTVAPITGTGAVGSPIGLATSGVWGTAPLDAVTFGTTSTRGRETYVDSAGQLRAKPDLITTHQPTDLAPTYPWGTSIMYIPGADIAKWPGGQQLVTHKTDNNIIAQWCTNWSAVLSRVWYRNGTSTAWAPWVEVSDIALPAMAVGYQTGGITITSTARYTETPTAVRASIANPHPSRRMLATVRIDTWMDYLASAASGGCYFDLLVVSGGTSAWTQNAIRWVTYAAGAHLYSGSVAEGGWWIDPGASATFGISAAKTAAGDTYSLNYTRTQIIPERYE